MVKRCSVIPLAVVALVGCVTEDPPDPPIVARADDASQAQSPNGPVWGVADLHAHPASHIAFAGNETGRGGMFWGPPGTTVQRVNTLPEAIACDAETHLFGAPDQVQRATRSLVFRTLAFTTGYPHGPYGADPPEVEDAYRHWPDARDLFHQLMNVEAMYRAYRGGVRLMYASVTDNQTFEGVFNAPALPAEIPFSLERDRINAERMLRFITEQAEQNADWMEVVTSPAQARRAIRQGRLALMLSLEMDFLSIDDVEDLRDQYGVSTIVPIHLADNPVGGSAAFEQLFNSHSNLLSTLYGAPEPRFQTLEGNACLRSRFGWPDAIAFGPANFDIGKVTAMEYAALRYENLAERCPGAGFADTGIPFSTRMTRANGIPFLTRMGHRNAIGLLDANYIRQLMDLGLVIDLAHAGDRAREAIMAEAARRDPPYPLVNSHSGVFPADAVRDSERASTLRESRYLAATGGITGVGTQGVRGVLRAGEGDGSTPREFAPEVLYQANGGPLHVFLPGPAGRCLVTCDASDAADCPAADATPADRDPSWCAGAARIGIPQELVRPTDTPPAITFANADRAVFPFDVPAQSRRVDASLDIELCDGRIFRHIEHEVLDERTPTLAFDLERSVGQRRVAEVRSARLRWFTPTECLVPQLEDGQTWPMNSYELGAGEARRTVGPDRVRSPDHWITVRGGRHEVQLFHNAECPVQSIPDCNDSVLTPSQVAVSDPGPDPQPDPGDDPTYEVLQITVTSGRFALRGATAFSAGSELCVQLLYRDDDDACLPAEGAGVTEISSPLLEGDCGSGWRSMNRGASWATNTPHVQYAVLDTAERMAPVEVCGMGVMLLPQDARRQRFEVERVEVARVGDPIRNWARMHRHLLHQLFDNLDRVEPTRADPNPLVTVALGTDTNGLIPLFPISSLDRPAELDPGTVSYRVDPYPGHVGPVRFGPFEPMGICSDPDGDDCDTQTMLRMGERGMASWGMMPEFFDALEEHEFQDVLDAIFRSAEQTIRLWECADDPGMCPQPRGAETNP